jgi:hypothetical protein
MGKQEHSADSQFSVKMRYRQSIVKAFRLQGRFLAENMSFRRQDDIYGRKKSTMRKSWDKT